MAYTQTLAHIFLAIQTGHMYLPGIFLVALFRIQLPELTESPGAGRENWTFPINLISVVITSTNSVVITTLTYLMIALF